MTYYLLPKSSCYLYNYIDIEFGNKNPQPIISDSLSNYLYKIKEKISENEKQWDINKKYTNPYEYIHSNIPMKKRSVCKYNPLSRSFFKMIEILKTFNINFETPIHSFHLAEGPGGFIEALNYIRQNPDDKYIGMTLIDTNDNNIPCWKKSEKYLRENPNIILEYGPTQDGNILSFDNFNYCVHKYGSSMEIITGDGGFDFSSDFNKQELSITQLLFAQIAFAICMQKKGGLFILKIFDSFYEHTIDIIYILSSFYEKVYIIKPQTSRYANSEKYLVCNHFMHENNNQIYPIFRNAFSKMCAMDSTQHIYRFLKIPVSFHFMKKMEEYNLIFGEKQIQNIYFTLNLINNKNKTEKIDSLIKINIQKSIKWCIKNEIPYNIFYNGGNIFASNA
jgi:23S rRNA U2552 (ribose-2'-O)-methylase RlmE/FtsJ